VEDGELEGGGDSMLVIVLGLAEEYKGREIKIDSHFEARRPA
jgi:hypothetical protein